MADERRVDECTPAELLEAAIAKMGWDVGERSIELVVSDGHVRRAHAKQTTGRAALDVRGPA